MRIELGQAALMTFLYTLGCAPADSGKDDRLTVGDHSNSSDEGGADEGDAEPEDEDGSSDTDAPRDPEDERELEEGDSASLVSALLPTSLSCEEVGAARVTLRNTGTTTWSREDGYKLGMVDDEDPFYSADTRVWMPEDVDVSPGFTWTFTFEMTAPSTAGTYTSDWQMVHESVAWFGDQAATEVNVVCDDPGDGGGSGWTEDACARNGSEICDDEVFGVEPGRRYGLSCVGPEGGIGFVSSNTGPVMSDGMERCQGWEERGEDAWDSLEYIHSFVCNSERIVEVDLSDWSGGHLWFGSHDHPGGGGHMTNICLVSRPE